jgi:hypothetical protein
MISSRLTKKEWQAQRVFSLFCGYAAVMYGKPMAYRQAE